MRNCTNLALQIKSILSQLIQFQSITPHDQGCQDFMMDLLSSWGFECQRFDSSPVSNFFARYGNKAPLLLFAGHTDVVTPGDRSSWQSDPFVLTEKQGIWYGRGMADMKGALACMLVAVQQFIQAHPQFPGSVGFLITSGEEGDDYDRGTPVVMSALAERGIKPDYCIVGEPTSRQCLGDTLKIGRRGSLSGRLVITGKQGHVAYPHLAMNPIHHVLPALTELSQRTWDTGNTYFPPTTFQMTAIQAGELQAKNVIPQQVTVQFNFRYSTEQTAEQLMQAVVVCLEKHNINLASSHFDSSVYSDALVRVHGALTWQHSGAPFLTAQGRLLDSCQSVIKDHLQQAPTLCTGGGTSDGRFIAPYGVEVVELGLRHETIHQVNECASIEDIEHLTQLYYEICIKLLESE